MQFIALQSQLQESDRRRIELLNGLLSFKHWLSTSDIRSAQAESLLERALLRLQNYSFNLVLLSEFSRGKSELINALMFDEYQCRVLPSRPGRTTLCTTEIAYDPAIPLNCLHLLPISTRRGGISLRSYKQIPKHWVNIEFDIDNPASIQDALGRVAERQYVSEEQARDLGFDCTKLNRHPQNIHQVEVPKWRYAMVNIQHPLTSMGLRIIDTPGLNAVGAEPELNHGLAQSQADATILCLSADAPISESDKQIWRDYINTDDNSGVLVVVNKIDSLWDDLISAPSEESTISGVRTETALSLGLPLQQVLPTSAKKALLAKARGDRDMLLKSNFRQIESVLSAQLSEQLKQLFKLPEIEDALALLRQTYKQVHQRLMAQGQRISDVAAGATIASQRDQLKELYRQVHQAAILNRSHERLITHRFEILANIFGRKQTDRVLNYLNTAAADPAPILRPAIQATLKQLQLGLQKLAIEVEQTNQLLTDIYDDPSLTNERLRLSSRKLDITDRQKSFAQFKHRCEHFLHSVESSNKTLEPVVRHFLHNLAEEVTLFIEDTNVFIEAWYEHALTPLTFPNEFDKHLMQRELLTLSRCSDSDDSATTDRNLRAELTLVEDHLFSLNKIVERIDHRDNAPIADDKVIPLSFARRKGG
jgi:hypothetical protein